MPGLVTAQPPRREDRSHAQPRTGASSAPSMASMARTGLERPRSGAEGGVEPARSCSALYWQISRRAFFPPASAAAMCSPHVCLLLLGPVRLAARAAMPGDACPLVPRVARWRRRSRRAVPPPPPELGIGTGPLPTHNGTMAHGRNLVLGRHAREASVEAFG